MNLYHALTELRRQKFQSPLWADQICINQQDREEKIAQLGIMVDVFGAATRVTIWLGKLSMYRSSALDFMEGLTDEPQWPVQKLEKSETTMSMNKLNRSLEAASSFSSSLDDHYHWLGVMLVVSRQWFARAWTLQEFLLANDFRILMGNREIAPKTIIRACSQIIDFFARDPLSTHEGLNVFFLPLRKFILRRGTLFDEREQFKNGKRYSAEEYLGVIRVRRATVMKDKVFAGAALLKEQPSSSVDYRSTTLEIYMAYALERLWPETGIFSLSLVGGSAAKTEGLPSWAPDLNSPLHPDPLRYCGCPTFTTPLLSQEKPEYHIDNKTLRVKAAKWDVIKEVGESIWSWTRYDDEAYNSNNNYKMRTTGSLQNERFGLMFALLNSLGSIYPPTGERTIDVLWQTLIGGMNLKTEEDVSVWRDRFQQWFAFTLITIRSNFYVEKKHSGNILLTASGPKKWMVPLIADWEQLEKRVSTFLDLHDTSLETTGTPETPLRKQISYIAKRLWGTETIEESGFWKESMNEILSTVRREDFYESISFFGQQFELVYDGRRIFVSEKGYLGTGVEEVKKGDLIFMVAGADVPYILRPVVGKEHTFTLVGEAYIHGIMDGRETLVEGLEFGSIDII
jgi:hypothetical protein